MEIEKEVKPIRSRVPTTILAAFHGLLWMVLLGMMLWYVPTYYKIFSDFQADLPAISEIVIKCSFFSVHYWYLLFPLIAVLCVADSVILYALYSFPKATILKWIWLSVMLLVPLCLMAWTVLAMYLPLISISQKLS